MAAGQNAQKFLKASSFPGKFFVKKLSFSSGWLFQNTVKRLVKLLKHHTFIQKNPSFFGL